MRSFATPLCRAGHLPNKGGDHCAVLVSPNDIGSSLRDANEEQGAGADPISTLVGEMSGRTEGAAGILGTGRACP